MNRVSGSSLAARLLEEQYAHQDTQRRGTRQAESATQIYNGRQLAKGTFSLSI